MNKWIKALAASLIVPLNLFILAASLFWSSGVFAGDAQTGLRGVPLRWCAVKGSPAVEDPSQVGESTTDEVLWRRHERPSDNFWIPGANITFRSGFAVKDLTTDQVDIIGGISFPIIDDVTISPGSLEGDIERGTTEQEETLARCLAAWDAIEMDINVQRQSEGKDPVNFSGPIAVNIRRFVDSSGNEGFLGGVGAFFYSSSSSFPDVCMDPELIISMDDDAGYVIVKDNALLTAEERESGELMAHELGHALFLEHGNGLDDDVPPNGLWDGDCDPGESDLQPFTLMATNTGDGTNLITSLQSERARIVANKMPGSHTDPPNVLIPGQAFSDHRVDPVKDVASAEVDIVSVGMVVNDVQQVTVFNHILFDTIPIEVHNKYLMFLDLDDNPATGGSPSNLGFDTDFQGAEMVTEVFVTFIQPPALTLVGTGIRNIVPTVWKYQSGSFVVVSASGSGISAQVGTVREEETGTDRYDVVSLLVPNSVIGPLTKQARMQAVAQQIVAPLNLDRLPDSPASAGLPLFLVKPDFPVCGVDPLQVAQGKTAIVQANGLIPEETAKVYLGDALVATGPIDEDGNVDIEFPVPALTGIGLRLVTVGVMGTALTADCSVEVIESPLEIDLKPGSDPNCINLDNKGRVAIALFGQPTLDVKSIDASTIVVSDGSGSSVAPVRTSTNKDVSDPPDGINDFVAHFKTSELKSAGLLFTGNQIYMMGSLKDGTQFTTDVDEVQIADDPNSSCQ